MTHLGYLLVGWGATLGCGLVYAVHLADHIAMLGGTGTGVDTLHYPLDADYGHYLELSRDDVESVMATVDDEYRKHAESFGEAADG